MGKVVRSITQPIQRGIGQLNPFNPGSAVGSAVQQIPGVKEAQNVATQVFQPIEKAVVQPVSRGLASFDKAVGNTIPGGWGTLGTVAASMIPGGQFAALGLSKTAAMTGLGALTGSGVLRPGRSFNLQGALMGGAMAYGSSQLADYAAAAGGAPTVDTSGALTAPVTTPGVPLVTEPPMGIMDSISKYAGDVGRSITAPPSNLVQEPGIMDSIANSFSNAGRNISSFADAATTPSTYTDFGKSYAQNVSDIGSGIKNLITTPGLAKATTAATGINPVGAAGATLFGATGLMALDEQEKMLKEQLANQQIAQAEYDQALGEINRQRDYAAKMVRENPFKLESTSDLSPDKTVYERTRPERNLYERYQNNLYAEGGDVKSSGISLQQSQRPYLGTTLYDNPTSIAQSRVGIDSLTNDNLIKAIGNQLPPGIIAPPPGSMNTAALVPFYNPQTDEEFIAPSGGYTATPESGFVPGLSPRLGKTNYLKNKRDSRLYAYGGYVDDELGGDYSAMGMSQGNLQRGLFGMGYKEGGNVSKKERQEFLDMINLEAKSAPPARYIEGVGFVTPPPAVQGRLGANIDALGGNVRAGASGMAMMGPDGKVMTMPGMMDVGYRRRVGPGDLDVGLQRAIRAMPGRDRDYAVNANYSIPFAEGGQPRFLSGGGDGMSDSIPATIEGKQQARLADGEFVIPADVVSHLGNGSSKAGAKRLYAMMDKVRQERTGTTKQGKQINPRKFMPA